MQLLPFDPQQPAHALALWQGRVQPDWHDYNGHMTEHRYLQVAGESTDAFLHRIGIDLADTARTGAYFTLQSHITHLAECALGDRLHSETELLGYDGKRLHLYHRIYREGAVLAATSEHLMLHMRGGLAQEALAETQARLAALFAWQAVLALPAATGSVLRQPLPHRRRAQEG